MSQSRPRTLIQTVLRVATDVILLVSSALRSHAHLAAESLFLRQQLALYLERQVKPRRADDATRITLVALSRFVGWRGLLTIVKPECSSGGTERTFDCFGAGNPAHPVDRRFQRTCAS